MDYQNKILDILKNAYDLNTQVLQSQNKELLKDQNFADLFEAFWISNIKLKNIIDLIEITNK
ncbi:hypothetical protein [Paenibacillus apis]|uniref:Uncharacterized protein n=1 Tax=Paenibacillus apis TaxID=1792174 RepID=A0A919Y1J0_9BACL|nr:hypothetical protein [Paenibacillus apis]GIO40340.1 hypothetical protein J41TS4_00980 [Paenibacillus apis]